MRHAARRIGILVVALPLSMLIGCTSPLIDAVQTLRADAVTSAQHASDKDLTTFSIKDPAEIATISDTSIAVTLPNGTDVTHLVAVFTTTGASVTVNSVSQTSNVTINDFTSPVVYVVTATDGSTKQYTVTVTLGIVAPILTATAAASGITTTTATSGGTISNTGGSTITVSGICWSTAQNPTIGSCTGYTTDGTTSVGSWSTSSMTGLTAGTTYYVRAYATNTKGTGYGPQVSFLTVPAAPAAPTLAAVGGSTGSGKLSVSWSAVTGATLYEVYCGTASDIAKASQPTGGTDISGTSCTVSGLTNYTTYYVWIFAKYGTEISAASPYTSCVVGKPVTAITLQRQADTQTISGGRTSDNFVLYSRDTLVATVAPSDATDTAVSWSTSSSTYAAISASGLTCLITAGSAAGSATVTATASDGQGASVSCAITVTSNAVGQTGPGGGKIVYDQGSYTTGTSTSATYGWRYLETSVASTSRTALFCSKSLASDDPTYSGIGYGPTNTSIVLSHFGTDSTAAYLAHCYQDSATGGAFSDWFLPSQGEMSISAWLTYAAIPAYYVAWSSYANANMSAAEAYANASYDYYSTSAVTGWYWFSYNSNSHEIYVPMRRF